MLTATEPENELETRRKVIVFCFIHQQHKEVKIVDKIRVKTIRTDLEQWLNTALVPIRHFTTPDRISDVSLPGNINGGVT